MAKLIIDAGHDPDYQGASSDFANEVDHNRAIVDKLKRYVDFEQVPDGLGSTDGKGNGNLIKKIDWINNNSSASDFLVSIHTNCCGGNGNETWYYGGSSESEARGVAFADFVEQETGMTNRGSKPDTDARFGRLGIIRDTHPWAWIVECGFIDNQDDMNVNPDKWARGIARFAESLGFPVRNLNEPVQTDPYSDPVWYAAHCENVRNLYRTWLLREPESQAAVDNWAHFNSDINVVEKQFKIDAVPELTSRLKTCQDKTCPTPESQGYIKNSDCNAACEKQVLKAVEGMIKPEDCPACICPEPKVEVVEMCNGKPLTWIQAFKRIFGVK